MNLQELKQYFGRELDQHYPITEWETFYQWLVEERLGLDRMGINLQREMQVAEEDLGFFERAIQRLQTHEPIQYILGHTEFYGLKLQVNSHTLIPRPETEDLVDWIGNDWRGKDGCILDLGTGSGCIALALAKELPQMTVAGLDRSAAALMVARANASNLELKVDFFEADIRTVSLVRKYDVLVSNPPYVRELERAQMKPNVLEHEPEQALFVSNDDPLLFYRYLGQLGLQSLAPNGALYLEINEYLGKETVALLRELGYQQVELRPDLFGKDRMIKARLHEST